MRTCSAGALGATSVVFASAVCQVCTAATPSPMKLFIRQVGGEAFVDVQNTEDAQRQYIIGVGSWVQREDGAPQVTPTKDLIVDRPLITVPAHASVRVNVKLIRPLMKGRTYYRLTIGEAPDAKSKPQPGVNVRARIDLPIFVGDPIAAADLVLGKLAVKDGELGFNVTNVGEDYARPELVRIQAIGKGARFFSEREGWYLLPHTPRRYSIGIDKSDCADVEAFQIEIHSGEQHISERLGNSPSFCEALTSKN